jgi:tetrahydromethanopterin S-methyltransferase subunit E
VVEVAVTAGAVIVAAGVVFVRALIAINRRVNDHAERLAHLEGETHRKD